jgi:nicotinate-nucleotide--dimethylbenzimidazole phosphoribosyltransferase
MTAAPFDDIKALIDQLQPAPESGYAADPALGRLGEIAAFLSRWRAGGGKPRVLRPIVALYAGTHGVADKARGPGSSVQVRERLEAVAAGGAAINAIAQAGGAGLEAFDLAIDRPVRDITQDAAMSERECAATMAFGMEALAKQPDLLLLGDITAGGEASAAAIALALHGGEASDWADAAYAPLVREAVQRAEAEGSLAPLDILRQFGGREIAALAGAIVAARTQNVPVLLDGYGAVAAAAVLQAIAPRAVEHVMAAHAGAGPGQRRLLAAMGLEPLLDLNISAGEGTGAGAALALVKLACDAA